MSYSFSVTANTKEEAKRQIADYFDNNVIVGQPTHAADRAAAVACGQAFVDVLVDPGKENDIFVNMSGSLGWRDSAAKEFHSASVNVSASVRFKDK